jgi:hypothetical protein
MQRLLTTAAFTLTIGVNPPALEAANCNAMENLLTTGVYPVESALPFLRDRCVEVKPLRNKTATPVRNSDPSHDRTIVSGDPR